VFSLQANGVTVYSLENPSVLQFEQCFEAICDRELGNNVKEVNIEKEVFKLVLAVIGAVCRKYGDADIDGTKAMVCLHRDLNDLPREVMEKILLYGDCAMMSNVGKSSISVFCS